MKYTVFSLYSMNTKFYFGRIKYERIFYAVCPQMVLDLLTVILICHEHSCSPSYAINNCAWGNFNHVIVLFTKSSVWPDNYAHFAGYAVWHAGGWLSRLAKKYRLSTLYKKQQTNNLVLAGTCFICLKHYIERKYFIMKCLEKIFFS